MSDERSKNGPDANTGPDAKAGADAPGPGRRRRRRRRPRGGIPGSSGESAQAAERSRGGAPGRSGDAAQTAGRPRGGAPGRSGDAAQTAGRPRGGAPGRSGDAARAARPAPPDESQAAEPGRQRRRRRRRGRRTAAGEPARSPRRRSEAPVPPPGAPAPATPASPASVDDGWTQPADPPAAAQSARADSGRRRPARAGWGDDRDAAEPATTGPRARPPARVKWGDDRDAPTPEVSLAPDLPPDPPPDDPDPLSVALDLPDEEGEGDAVLAAQVRNVAGVKFTRAGKIYLYDAGEQAYEHGDTVVVEGERGVRLGEIAVASTRRPHSGHLKRILRRPSAADHRNLDRAGERSGEILRAARERARELKLPIKLFRAEMALSGNKAHVYFSAEEKVDSRELARDLSRELSCRVEMRQTGVRDEAKMVGGIGSCGQELCCTTWLPQFVPVSIKMAKDQGMVLNPTKVAGQCGRLKCCLVYEQAMYAELRKGLPKLGKRVITEAGEGRVVEVDVLRQRVRVSHPDGEFETLPASEVRPMFPSNPPRRKTPVQDKT